VPALLVGGWQDWFVEQTLEQYRVLRDRGVDVGLTVGPWHHLGIDAAVTARESLRWLSRHLPVEGAPPVPPRPSRVRVWVTGAGKWRDLADWPPEGTTDRTWFLGPGSLLDDVPGGSPAPTTFRYNPMDPTPSVGGRSLSFRAGRRDNRRLEARDDVRVFTTARLEAPVELLGGARVRLCVESDNPYADVFVRLCDVEPNGRSINITDRLVRLDPVDGEQPAAGERVVETTLPDIAHRFRAGHRIRLQVSGGAHPRYARNLGTGEPPGQATRAVPVVHRICHSSASPSTVTLPTG
jgi:putative CocE/NonD family hydrolase